MHLEEIYMSQKKQHALPKVETVQQAIDQIMYVKVPKLDENLRNLGYPRIQVCDIKREGRYTRVVLIGESGTRIAVGIAHRSVLDDEDAIFGLTLAFDRAVDEYIHGKQHVDVEVVVPDRKSRA